MDLCPVTHGTPWELEVCLQFNINSTPLGSSDQLLGRKMYSPISKRLWDVASCQRVKVKEVSITAPKPSLHFFWNFQLCCILFKFCCSLLISYVFADKSASSLQTTSNWSSLLLTKATTRSFFGAAPSLRPSLWLQQPPAATCQLTTKGCQKVSNLFLGLTATASCSSDNALWQVCISLRLNKLANTHTRRQRWKHYHLCSLSW